MYVVGGGASVVSVKWDMTSLRNAAGKVDRYLRDFTAINRECANIVNNERRATVSYITGHFARAGYVRANSREAYVGLRNTGWRSNDYIGVQEFGGTIPRHKGHAREQRYTYVKPHGGPGGDGYFLYPALERKRHVVLQVYEREVGKIAARFGA